ncbi:MAG: hypothetical protein HY812_06200 [Planctomycetes bacterium]|nr:hypothetical protein [Planctomycetota bacterium]
MIAISHVLPALLSLLLAQQEGPEAQPKPPQPEPQPGISIQPSGAQPAQRSRDIESVKEYRAGRDGCPYVRRLEEVRDLDLSKIDYDAPVVARVNDTDITQDEFLLWYALNAGQNGILRSQLVILTNQAVQKAIDNGGDPAVYEVTPEEVDARLRAEEDQNRAQGEEALTAYQSRIEASMGWEKYKDFLRAHLLNERLLLPPIKPLDPSAQELNPGLPLESAELLEKQKDLRNYLTNSYETGQELPPMFRMQFLRMLQQEMIKRADIKYALEEGVEPEGAEAQKLPKGVYMTVNGEPVTVQEVLDFVPPQVEVKEGALRLCILYRALDDALADNDVKVGAEEFEALFRAHEAEYEGTLFPLQSAISFQGFFNMSEYREYYRRRVAFEKMLQGVVGDDDLREHHTGYGRLFYESGKVDCEVFWVSLVETEKQSGLAGQAAWDEALRRTTQAKAALLEGKSSNEEIRKQFCSEDKAFPKGTTTPKTRNELRQCFSENQYLIFIQGYSLADDIFYNRVEGDVVGPVKIEMAVLPGMRETLGYMLVKVLTFTKSTPIREFEIQKALVVSDYHDLRFSSFAHECLKNAKITLTEK